MVKNRRPAPKADPLRSEAAARARSVTTWALLLILLVGAALRLAHLTEAPPGLTHDEAAHLQDARRIWEGARPIYLTSGYGREPFYDYVTAPLVGLLGMRVYTGRFSSVVWGLGLIALTYLALRGPLGRSGALGAALLMAVSFWPLSTSRQALRSITMPALFTAAMALIWRGMYTGRASHRSTPRTRTAPYIGAGVLLGLGFYTYMPARAVWAVPVLFWLTLAWTDRSRFRAQWRGVVLMLVVMIAAAAPLLIYLARNPQLEIRVSQLAGPLRAAVGGDPGPLLDRMGEAALMFSHRGDTHWMYNLSGRPLLPLPLAVLFYLGLALALVRLRESGPRLLLLWLLVGIAPALATGLESSSLRAIAAQPAVFGLCALPFGEISRWAGSRPRLLAVGRLSSAVLLLLSVWVAADTVRTYFVTWADRRDVRVAYYAHLAAEAAYLGEEAPAGLVTISTFYPSRPHDPATMEVLRGRVDPNLRWFDGRGALVFPSSKGVRLLIPSAVPLDPALEGLVAAHAIPLGPITLLPTDLVTQVTVLEWDAEAALTAVLARARGPVGICPGGGLPPDPSCRPLSLPVELGGRLALVGYRLLTPTVRPGEEVALVTFWQVHGPAEADLVLFAHLLEDESHVLGQSDRLDAPAWNWHPGDVFAQVHRFPIPVDAPPGRYPLQVGAYQREDGARLPVLVVGRPADDRVLLEPVEVRAP
ncbi:MAG TPA: hypothetical protein EYH30_03235 [Anaerolineales bacterium]|nr:hypothetical protein [Anaerolineae bacterium]HIQ01134.1 hypothetical protein [Anaerolineales bacterium]